MSRSQRRRRVGFVLWAVITCAVIVSDWPADVFSDFWVDHPLVAGVVAGLLLFGIAAFVVNAWIAEREARAWARVAQIAFKALGRSVEEVREGMDELVTGVFPYTSPAPFSPELAERLERVIADDRGLEPVTRADPDGRDHEQRLLVLLDNVDWLYVANEGLKMIRWRHRDRLAMWLPAMLTSERLARTMDRIANLNELVNQFHNPIYILLSRHQRGLAGEVAIDDLRELTDEDLKRLAIARWHLAILETVAIQEELNRAAGEDGFTNLWARERLRPQELSVLHAREAERAQPYDAIDLESLESRLLVEPLH